MDMTPEMEQKIVDACVEQVMKGTGAYRFEAAIVEKVAVKVADAYFAKHELELLKGIDLDAVTRVATLKLITMATRSVS